MAKTSDDNSMITVFFYVLKHFLTSAPRYSYIFGARYKKKCTLPMIWLDSAPSIVIARAVHKHGRPHVPEHQASADARNLNAQFIMAFLLLGWKPMMGNVDFYCSSVPIDRKVIYWQTLWVDQVWNDIGILNGMTTVVPNIDCKWFARDGHPILYYLALTVGVKSPTWRSIRCRTRANCSWSIFGTSMWWSHSDEFTNTFPWLNINESNFIRFRFFSLRAVKCHLR